MSPPIYSHSKRRQDFEKFISEELKKEEAAIVGYVQGKRVTFDGQETEKADLNKITVNASSIDIAKRRKQIKNLTFAKEKEDVIKISKKVSRRKKKQKEFQKLDEGVIKNPDLAKRKKN